MEQEAPWHRSVAAPALRCVMICPTRSRVLSCCLATVDVMHSDALFFEVPVPMSEVLPKMTHTITIGGKASDIYGTRYDRGKSSECLQDLPC